MGGKIYLVREGLTDTAALARTLWHEMLHFGLRRFMTRAQYIASMGKLYESDGWIKHKADRWVAGPEGKKLWEDGAATDYIQARGVDEALAELAEILQTNPSGYDKNDVLNRSLRKVWAWVAKLAEKFGFTDAAKAWRSYAARQDARDLVVSVFSRLREGAPPSMLTTHWHYSDPAFLSQLKSEKDARLDANRMELNRIPSAHEYRRSGQSLLEQAGNLRKIKNKKARFALTTDDTPNWPDGVKKARGLDDNVVIGKGVVKLTRAHVHRPVGEGIFVGQHGLAYRP